MGHDFVPNGLRHFHRLSPECTLDDGHTMSLRDLDNLVSRARELGAPWDQAFVVTETRDMLQRFTVPSIQWWTK